MRYTSEIYITNKNILKSDWQNLINIISNYNGLFKRWKIIILNKRNTIRYFIKTNCSLPPTINNLDSFLLKASKDIKKPRNIYTLISFSKIEDNIIDLVNKNEIKKNGYLFYLEINFIKLSNNKIVSRANYYIKKNNKHIKYHMLYTIPTNILTIDFETNKRYIYKSPPKYLEINKILHLLDTKKRNALLNIDTFPYLQGSFYLNQNNYSFDKHSIIIGSSGSGKSKFLSLLINNIYLNKKIKYNYKIVVIDPHASLEEDIGGIGKVIDFNNIENSIDLFINSNDDVIISVELILELLKNLISDQYNSKLERVLRHSIHLLLMYNSFSFKNLRKIILDLEYRNDIINKLKDKLPISIIEFFLSDYNNLKTKSYGEAISPIIGFIDEMEMIPVFNSEEKSKNLEKTIEENFLTLFSLNRTKIGDKITKTISGLIMQQLLILIQKRKIQEKIIFIIDEVSIIENPILSRFLSEARKYNLSLILVGQYFNQISQDLRNSIFANVINYYIFRISRIDANSIVENINMKIPLEDTKERKIKQLAELNNRECIARIESNGILLPAFKGTTVNFTSIPRKKDFTKKIIEKDKNTEKSDNKKIYFNINNNIKLSDILKRNSTSRRVVKE